MDQGLRGPASTDSLCTSKTMFGRMQSWEKFDESVASQKSKGEVCSWIVLCPERGPLMGGTGLFCWRKWRGVRTGCAKPRPAARQVPAKSPRSTVLVVCSVSQTRQMRWLVTGGAETEEGMYGTGGGRGRGYSTHQPVQSLATAVVVRQHSREAKSKRGPPA